MPVRGVAHAEDATFLHAGRVHVVDGPGGDGLEVDLEIGIADEVARDARGEGLVHVRHRLVDVVAPVDEPLVPRPHHPHEAHADAADVCARLQDPVENGRTMRDVFGEVGLEDDVHRPGDAHLACEG